jgi:fibro-slime domain-containing protein
MKIRAGREIAALAGRFGAIALAVSSVSSVSSVSLSACNAAGDSADESGGTFAAAGTAGAADGGASGGSGASDGEAGAGGTAGASNEVVPPAGGTGGGGAETKCDDEVVIVTGVVRDFKGCYAPAYDAGYIADCDDGGHPDFQTFWARPDSTSPCCFSIVESQLSADGKPVHVEEGPYIDAFSMQQTTSRARFDEWYRDTPGVNVTVEVEIPLALRTRADVNGCTSADECYVYESRENEPDGYFPIDGKGFADEDTDYKGRLRNFFFTTEVRFEFTYQGGEIFTFQGDDDVWVFLNDRLALDAGGMDESPETLLDLDARATELGLVIGETYPLAIFHAERRVDGSNLRIETTIECVKDDPIPR